MDNEDKLNKIVTAYETCYRYIHRNVLLTVNDYLGKHDLLTSDELTELINVVKLGNELIDLMRKEEIEGRKIVE